MEETLDVKVQGGCALRVQGDVEADARQMWRDVCVDGHAPAKVFGSGRGGIGGSYNDRMSGAGMIRKSSHSKAGGDGKAVMTPLPISKNVLERIDALGPEMQPMQKYILIGIMLDFYAKSQLIRELNRFASNADWGWFVMVFLFFLLSGSMTAMYWVLHYPMPTKAEIAKAQKEHQTKVFGFTKIDFKRMVRATRARWPPCASSARHS